MHVHREPEAEGTFSDRQPVRGRQRGSESSAGSADVGGVTGKRDGQVLWQDPGRPEARGMSVCMCKECCTSVQGDVHVAAQTCSGSTCRGHSVHDETAAT